jgi:hypothetical protein
MPPALEPGKPTVLALTMPPVRERFRSSVLSRDGGM